MKVGTIINMSDRKYIIGEHGEYRRIFFINGKMYFYDKSKNRIITVSVIDNLVKGASGQAVQNMNIMFNFLENSGLKYVPLSP